MVNDGQYLHDLENKNLTLFFFRKHIPLKGMKSRGKEKWGATLFCSHGAKNARGVVILLRNSFDCKVEESVADTNEMVDSSYLKFVLMGSPLVYRRYMA